MNTVWNRFHIGELLRNPGWTWKALNWKYAMSATSKYVTIAAVDQGDKLEGLVAVYPDKQNAIVDVGFLATAPWNYKPHRRRAGVGPALLSFSVRLSQLLGFYGKIRLSCLPTAISFYVGHGLIPTGATDADGYYIYELPPAEVAKFLAGITVIP